MLARRFCAFAWWCLLVAPCFLQLAAATMHASEIRHLRDQAREMFYHGYRNYMEHAFPWDELKPLSCEGRRWDHRERGDLDDVLGGYALTLVDSLDMLAVLGDREEFKRAVHLAIEHVRFDRDVTVSVFEATIRVIGGLIAAHVLASPDHLGVLTSDEYHGELLDMAIDLGRRLLPAFETPTGIPVHRVNLRSGLSNRSPTMTCPAAAGSLLVEFSYLSRLSGDPVFEDRARDAVIALWRRRSPLDLLGSSIDVVTGEWLTSHVGIGAGLDSYFEYLLKYHLISGNPLWLEMFNASYSAVEAHMNHDNFHFEVDMNYGRQLVRSQRISALQAFWPGLQVLAGDVSSAIRTHDNLFALWNKFGAMPEIFDLGGEGSVLSWARSSPLRPELIESTYHLYQATRDHKYLKIGRKLLEDIQRTSKVQCGYAGVGNIHTLSVEDRMDSYFLSETAKYLYLLFSEDADVIVPAMRLPSVDGNSTTDEICSAPDTTMQDARHGNRSNSTSPMFSRVLTASNVIFSTEGHVLPLDASLFARDRDVDTARSARHSSFACENGNAVAQQQRQHEIDKASKTVLSFLPIGVSVRVGDVHIRTLVAAPANFGKQLGRFGYLEAPLLLYTNRIGDACTPLPRDLASHVQGRFLFVTRGVCSFATKALHAQRRGAVGILVINTNRAKSPHPHTMRRYVITEEDAALARQVRIPLAMVSREDAAELHRLLTLRAQVDTTAEGSDAASDEVVVGLSAWLH